jgi:Na+-transporting NADH:ubiquinone oxidoreductase subunit F
MISILIPVIAISSIAAGLAALLVVAERTLGNYGPCEIDINGEKKLTVQGGRSLLSSLNDEKLFIPSACGGRGTCGVCKLKVSEGAGSVLATEAPFLDKTEKEDNTRLSCQVKVRNDLKIQIPEELFSVREYESVCTQIEELTYDTRLFRFELKEPVEIEFVPGQYIQLLCPRYKKSGEEVYRAYSIASDPLQRNVVDLIIRRVPNGICTTYCFDYLKTGDSVKITGPYGEFRLSDTDSAMIFIAGGSGMAPFVSILHQMKNAGLSRKAVYFFGGNQVRDLFMLEKMKEFEGELGDFKFVPVVARPDEEESWKGQTGLVTEAVKRSISDLSGYEGYLCGSPGMIDASIKVLSELGMDEEKIYYDKFA